MSKTHDNTRNHFTFIEYYSQFVTTPYSSPDKTRKAETEEMFNSIAWRYDFLNHFLFLGIDRMWRKRAIKRIQPDSSMHILDVATGTGDFALEALWLNPESGTGILLLVLLLYMLDTNQGRIIKSELISYYCIL